MKKVLIIDDDIIFAELIEHVLKKDGYQVTLSPSGEDALEKMKDYRPDLILLDVTMPGGMDGITLLKQLKSDPKYDEIHIIVLTNLSDDSSIEEVLKSGGAGYMVKVEHTPNSVLEAVKNLI